MSEAPRNAETLRQHFSEEIGPVTWKELERFFAQGMILEVISPLGLVDAAVAIALDNKSMVELWIADGLLSRLTDETARNIHENSLEITAVVTNPWILVRRK